MLTNTKNKTADEQLPPALSKTRSDDRQQAEHSTEEDRSSSTEVVVEWIAQPTTEEGRRNVRCRVDKTNQPQVTLVVGVSLVVVRDTKFDGEGQVCAVGASLVPALDCSADGAEDDG